jgi:hypothetical protein
VFLLDSILAAPGNAAFVLFKELARKAQEEWLDDDAIKEELQQLYTLLEAGQISDRDFEERECRLLERLEQIARAKFKDKWGEKEPAAAVEPLASAAALPAALSGPPLTIDVPVEPAAPFAAVPAVSSLPSGPETRALPATPIEPPAFAAPSVAVPPPIGGALSVFQVIESTMRSLALLKLRLSSITSVAKDEEGWRVTAELVERKGVPDTNDLLGMYEFRLDHAANVLRYERTRMRRRGDLNRS